MAQKRRDWADARAKVDAEGKCRVCKRRDRKLEAAHVIGRDNDEPKAPGSKTFYVKPERIVPLCGPFPAGCHGDTQERRTTDLLPHLTVEEQAQAVLDAGSIESARVRLAPSAYRQKNDTRSAA